MDRIKELEYQLKIAQQALQIKELEAKNQANKIKVEVDEEDYYYCSEGHKEGRYYGEYCDDILGCSYRCIYCSKGHHHEYETCDECRRLHDRWLYREGISERWMKIYHG